MVKTKIPGIMLLCLLIIINSYELVAQKDRKAKEAQGLAVGSQAPMFDAIDADSKLFRLTEALKTGPVVLIFYRGHWCPVCNQHLGILQDSIKYIEEKGASVIAISPEKPEFLEEMSEKSGAGFSLLYDEGYKIADAFDVTFKPSSFQVFTINVFAGAETKKAQSGDEAFLPIPATYVIDQNGIIIWRHFDPDYRKRSSVKDIISALNNK